jgi:glycosyltransferase involved in cell wall biosynthesis
VVLEKFIVSMSNPIRVLHVLGNLNQGGAESRIMDIYRAIDKSKVQFDFAIHTEQDCFFSKEVLELGGRYYIFPRFDGKNYFEYRRAWKDFFNVHKEYDIIHGHMTSTAFIYLKIAKLNNVKIRIAHARSAGKVSLLRKYLSKLSKINATNLLAVSKLAAISEFGKQALSKGEISIIPNAIDAEKYKFNPQKRNEVQSNLNIKNKLVIGHIGSFRYPKNHTFLIDIFKEIRIKRDDAVLLLIGDGELKENIEKKVSALNIQESVFFLGNRSDVPLLLQAMDALLFPSIYEGLPGVVLEAQASGLPCIISDAITNEVNITSYVEFISLSESANFWAEKVIANSYKKREDTFLNFVEKSYDIKSVTKWYENFYLSKEHNNEKSKNYIE